MDTQSIVTFVSRAFELAGIAVLSFGAVWSAVRAFTYRLSKPEGFSSERAFSRVRSDFGRTILLGLEILVAADIIRTVGIDPTLEGVMVLGLIVLIRTFLSFSLEVEIEGMLPWRRDGHRDGAESH